MQKLGIWAIAIAGAFLIGILSANPIVEAVGGWQPAVDGLDTRITTLENQPSQVYELIGTTTISAGETDSETITLLCDEGDWRIEDVNFVTVPPIFEDGIILLHDTATIQILDPASVESTGVALSKKVGYTTIPQLVGSGTPLDFDIDVTITILCFSPST